MKDSLKLLFIGNSFSEDTSRLMPAIALSLGIKQFKLCHLFSPGCSIPHHCIQLENDMPAYRRDLTDGAAPVTTHFFRARTAIEEDQWDWIVIQHGTRDGSRNTDPASHEKLPQLIRQIRQYAWPGAKVAFNMTWIGEPWHQHPEIVSYNGHQLLMYEKVAAIARDVLSPMAGLDLVCPTGTAIQNARALGLENLSRDGYHLSMDVGCYIAGLACLGALTGANISNISWAPLGMDQTVQQRAVLAAANALKKPFEITL